MESTDLNIWHIILESGLVVKAVLILLIVFSIASWAIVFLKRKAFKDNDQKDQQFLKKFYQTESLKNLKASLNEGEAGAFQTVFASAYEQIENVRSKDRSFLVSLTTRGIQKGINESELHLSKYLSSLASISSVAPFVGLFGTVWGIVNSFTGLASGGATLDAVAPGIAEALVATAVGLLAAIPALWFYNIFSSEKKSIHMKIDNFSQELLNKVEKESLDLKES